jgi:uncharacterized protein (DUF697 family)/predicted GTPase
MADRPTDRDPDEHHLRDAFNELIEVLSRIPGAGKLVNDVRELRALVVDRRAPRIAAIGRRGSGKSSLANALAGAEVLAVGAVADTTRTGRWIDVEHEGRHFRWLDTPGLRAGDTPGRRDEVRRTMTSEPPDVVLVMCKASQVDAGIDEDLAEITWLLERQRTVGLAPPGVIAVVTKVDELAPVAVKTPPYEGDKRTNIDRAVDVLRGHLERAKITPAAVVPVGTYLRWFKDGAVAVDWRWNLDTLGAAVVAALPHAAQFEAARAFVGARLLRRRVARRIVGASTSIAFLVGATPLPLADLAILAPLQSAMITSLALLSGRRANARGVSEWLASLGFNAGAGVALREAARALVKLLPGLGGSISGAIAASGTWALGTSATRYFIDDASLEAARKAFEAARRAGPPPSLGDGATDATDATDLADAASEDRDGAPARPEPPED